MAATAAVWIPSVSTAIAQPVLQYSSGYDVSYPQCGHQLPTPGRFAIVGVNGGTAGSRNVCLKHELRWAARSAGTKQQAGASLYLNTGNPGPRSSKWPKNNIDHRSGYPVADRFGKCHGRNTMACAWQYGWNTAEVDGTWRGIAMPAAYFWWLDVETTNVWQGNRQLNRAVLTGMVDYLESVGAEVGLYSTQYQWNYIAGAVNRANPIYSLPEWLAGASTRSDAKQNCWQRAFIPGGSVAISQWSPYGATVDGDVSCPGLSWFRKLRESR